MERVPSASAGPMLLLPHYKLLVVGAYIGVI